MKCNADAYVKDCANGENCCEECKYGYEECIESCCIFDKTGSCKNCKFCQED